MAEHDARKPAGNPEDFEMRLCPQHGPYRVFPEIGQDVRKVVPFAPPDALGRPADGASFSPSASGMIECPTCRTERQARRVEQAQHTQHAELIRASGIPPRFLNKTLANLAAPSDRPNAPERQRFDAALRAIHAYARGLKSDAGSTGAGRWLILSGRPGTGKTHIACGLARLCIESAQLRCLYVQTHEMLATIKSTYHRDAVITEREALQQYVQPDLLLLDEVGTTRLSAIDGDLLFRVLNARYEQIKPVVLITNLTLAELPATLGERVIDRAREDGGMAIQCDWPSRRHTGERGRSAFDFTFF